MRATQRRLIVVALIGSLGLAFVGQFYFANKRSFMWDGVFLYLASMALFAWVVARFEARPTTADRPTNLPLVPELWQALHHNTVRLAVLLVALLLMIYVGVTANARPQDQAFGDLVVLWGLSIVLAVGAFVDWLGAPALARRSWAWMRRHSPEVTLVLGLTVATFLLRVINLAGIPYVLSGDEASMGLEAINFIEGRRGSPFVTGWFSNPTMYFYLQAGFLRALGVTVPALRLSSALIAIPTVLCLYVFSRRYYGGWVAILVSILFATYHYAIHFGRIGINNIWDPFFGVGIILFVSLSLEKKSVGYALVSGLLIGFSLYFSAGARLAALILALYMAHWALSQRGLLRENLTRLVIMGLIALVVTLPLLMFLRAHPNDAMAPWTRRAIFPLGWVDEQMRLTGKSEFAIVFQQFCKSILAFNYFYDPTFWYFPGIPLLQFLPSIFFIFGLTYSIIQWRKREYFLLFITFILVVIFGATLLENPPSSHRLVLVIPAVLLCVVLGIIKVCSLVQQGWRLPRQVQNILALALVLIVSVQSLTFYFNKYTPSHVFGGVNTEVADRMGKYLRALGPGYQCYFFGPPRMYYGFATIPYLAQGVTGTDVKDPLTDQVTFVNPQRDAVFVFLPERLGELDVVRRSYATGLLREFRDQKGQILFIAYEVDL